MPDHPTIRLTRIQCYDEPGDGAPSPDPSLWTVILKIGDTAAASAALVSAREEPDERAAPDMMARPA